MSRTEDAEGPAPGRRELPSAAEAPEAAATDDRSSASSASSRIPAGGGSGLLRRLGVPAVLVDRDHRIREANHRCAALFAGERLAGRRCYEVFHHRRAACDAAGDRCPVRRLRETGEPCRVVHVHQTSRGAEHHDVAVYRLAAGGRSTVTCLELRPIAVASARPRRSGLVGRSGAFNRMLALVLRAAPRSTPVLLLGETGTGREEVARALHQLGRSPQRAFVCVHCAGLAGERFAGKLLGSKAGGEIGGEGGKIEAARSGTLYLADVGALEPPQQGELLRLLKTGSLRKAARAEGLALGFRLICGAGPDLPERAARGDFAADLYYRLSIFPIDVPSLRERREDLPLLAECVLEELGHPLEVHPRVFSILERHPLPGNLRELRRILEYACLHDGEGVILPEHLPPDCRLAP